MSLCIADLGLNCSFPSGEKSRVEKESVGRTDHRRRAPVGQLKKERAREWGGADQEGKNWAGGATEARGGQIRKERTGPAGQQRREPDRRRRGKELPRY